MAARSKSIARRIPWSLAVKAFVFCLVYLQAPWWLFVAAGLYFFAVPLFQHAYLTFPFLILLFLAYYFPPSVGAAAFVGIVFFFLIGLRDLVFINRIAAYVTMVLALFGGSMFLVFSAFNAAGYTGALTALAGAALLGTVLFRHFLGYAAIPLSGTERRVVLMGTGFIIWHAGMVALFLPLTVFAQTLLVFASAAFLGEYIIERTNPRFSWIHLADEAAVFALAILLILGTASWRL